MMMMMELSSVILFYCQPWSPVSVRQFSHNCRLLLSARGMEQTVSSVIPLSTYNWDVGVYIFLSDSKYKFKCISFTLNLLSASGTPFYFCFKNEFSVPF
jgi:hypothetical protein